MTNFDAQPAIDILLANRGTLSPDYIAEAKARLVPQRTNEDRREAAKLCIETAKMLLTIAVGLLVATYAWMQFANRDGHVPWASWTMFPFYAAAVLLVISMFSGFLTISAIYKRGEGREAADQSAWSTEHVRRVLNLQSGFGLLALVALFAAVLVLGLSGQPAKNAVTVTIPGQVPPAPAGNLTIQGDWQALTLKTAANQQVILPKINDAVTISCQ
jgi:hypothetical protein